MYLKSSILFAALLVVIAPSPFNEDYNDAWEVFKVQFERNYDPKEDSVRRMIFEENVRMIAKHNLEADVKIHDYTLGINEFTDKTPEELETMTSCCIREEGESNRTTWFVPPPDFQPPNFVDWRSKGYVTLVKYQGTSCGSCWAFSSTGSLEGQHKARTGKLVSLSEQNLIDCSKNGNYGCKGGYINRAFEYVIKNGGIGTEAAYPYEGRDGPCRFQRSQVGAVCRNYVKLPQGNEATLKAAVATVGPISVGIDGNSATFYMYRQGVYNNPNCRRTNLCHAVLVVGYGTTKHGKDYWIVKNSWGTKWGTEGYIQMSRNRNNQCGIASRASYPIM